MNMMPAKETKTETKMDTKKFEKEQRKANKPKLSPDEQQKMLDWIIQHNYYHRVKGYAMYKEMVEAKVVPGRTYQTLHCNMKRSVLNPVRLERFRLKPEEIKKFTLFINTKKFYKF